MCRVDELVRVSNWAPGAVALVVEELGMPKRFVLLVNSQFLERGEHH